jgi:hypothetical protein
VDCLRWCFWKKKGVGVHVVTFVTDFLCSHEMADFRCSHEVADFRSSKSKSHSLSNLGILIDPLNSSRDDCRLSLDP